MWCICILRGRAYLNRACNVRNDAHVRPRELLGKQVDQLSLEGWLGINIHTKHGEKTDSFSYKEGG